MVRSVSLLAVFLAATAVPVAHFLALSRHAKADAGTWADRARDLHHRNAQTQQQPSAPSSAKPGAVRLVLQLTDVHFSSLAAHEGGDPRRPADLQSLAAELLSRWPLAAAVVTGDLTEAKDQYGGCRQDEREWQTYQEVWKGLSHSGGIPPGYVYDIRGNHDTFDSGPRCTARDFYCRYSARAAAGRPADHPDGPAGRVFIDPVYDSVVPVRHEAGGAARAAAAAVKAADVALAAEGRRAFACPVLVLVGIDASLDPGLRSPTNFLGVVRQSLLDELDQRLGVSVRQMVSAGCAPPYIAYGHYPLSTIAYTGGGSRGGGGDGGGGDGGAGVGGSATHHTASNTTHGHSSVQAVLVRHGVSAYLCGHLHGAFGRRLHRLHSAAPAAAAATAASTAAASAANSGGGGDGDVIRRHLLELESVDWKYGRTVRLLTVDPEGWGAGSLGGLGFADFRYHPPALPPAGTAGPLPSPPTPPQPAAVTAARLEPFDPSCVIGSHLALIVSPPDARYAPQLLPYTASAAVPSAAAQDARFRVRALLLPLPSAAANVTSLSTAASSAAAASDAASRRRILLHWACHVVGGIAAGGEGPATAAAEGGSGKVLGETPGLSWQPRYLQGSGRRRRQWRQLSGVVQMQEEEEEAEGYSIYSADLADPRQTSSAAAPHTGAAHAAAAASSGPLACPPGLLVVQVHVYEDDVVGDVGGAASTSAERLLHWRPPPPQPRSSATAASSAGSGAAVVTAEPLGGDASGQSGGGSSGSGGSGGGAGGFTVGTAVQPAPLGQSLLEWAVLHVPMHMFGRVVFVVQWCVFVLGLLLLPRAWHGFSAMRQEQPYAALQRERRQNAREQQPPPQWRRQRQRQQQQQQQRQQPHGSSWLSARWLLPGWAARSGSRRDGVGGGPAAAVEHVRSSSGLSRADSDLDAGSDGEAVLASSVCIGGGSGGRPGAVKRSASGSSCSGGSGDGGSRLVGGTAVGAATAADTARQLTDSGGDVDDGDGHWSLGGGAERPYGTLSGSRLLLWPLYDTAALARHHPGPWAALALYGIFVAVGPWMAAEFVSPTPCPAEGQGGGGVADGGDGGGYLSARGETPFAGYGVLTAYGVFIRAVAPAGGGGGGAAASASGVFWARAPSEDYVVVINFLFLFTIAPALLLCASAAARWRQAAAAAAAATATAAAAAPPPLVTWRQAAALALVATFNVLLCWKLSAGLGWSVLVLSPAAGWLLPLVLGWLLVVRRQVGAGVWVRRRHGRLAAGLGRPGSPARGRRE